MKFFNCILLFVVIVGAASSPCSVDKTCPDSNEECSDCASSCPTTCQSVCQKPRPCTKECRVSECVCKPGLILNEVSSKCIAPSKCPKCECQQNEMAVKCNLNCELMCSPTKIPQICMPANPCLPGCTCAFGFLRDVPTGMCVTFDKCSKYVEDAQ